MSMEEDMEFSEFAEEVAEISKVLSHKARVLILTSLRKRSLSEVMSQAGLSTFQAMQRHVNVLLNAGLIKKGKDRGVYELTEDGMRILNILNHFKGIPKVKEAIEKGKKKQLKVAMIKYGSGLTKEDIVKLLEELERG